MRKLTLSLAVTLASSLVGFNYAKAQGPDVFTEAPINAPSDVNAGGTAVLAYDVANVSTTVNGVDFSGQQVQNGVTLGISFDSEGLVPPFANNFPADAGYRSILAGGDFEYFSGVSTLTFSGLTAGSTYQAQFFVFDDRLSFVRSESVTGTSDLATNFATLSYGGNGDPSMDGSYAIATFTAVGDSQEFSFTGLGAGASAQFNAVNLREVTAPEPSTWALLMAGIGFFGLFVFKARKKADSAQ